MNLIAHILFAVLLYSLLAGKSFQIFEIIFHIDYLVCILMSILPDLDHIKLLGKALRTGRFSVTTRTWIHELLGYGIFAMASIIVYMVISPRMGFAMLVGLSTHYVLDALTRPTRPFFPADSMVMFYHLAPRQDLKALIYYDTGITGILLSFYLTLVGYSLYIICPLLVASIIIFVISTPHFERTVAEQLIEQEIEEPHRLRIAILTKELLRKFISLIAKPLARLHQNRISGIELLLSLMIPVFLSQKIYEVAIITLFIILLLDVVDGEVARIRREASQEGWITDVATDRLSEVIIAVALPLPFILLTVLNTMLSISSRITGKHVIIPLRHVEIFYLVLLLFFHI